MGFQKDPESGNPKGQLSSGRGRDSAPISPKGGAMDPISCGWPGGGSVNWTDTGRTSAGSGDMPANKDPNTGGMHGAQHSSSRGRKQGKE